MFKKEIICSKSMHTMAVTAARYNDCGTILATASGDKTCKLLRTEDSTIVQELYGHTFGLNDCQWVNSSILATCSDDKSIRIWDAEYGKCLSRWLNHNSFVYCLGVHDFFGMILSGGVDGSVCLTDVRAARIIGRCDNAHCDIVSTVQCSPIHNHILTSSYDGTVRFWDLYAPTQCLATLIESVPVTSATYCRSGKFALVSSLDSSVSLYKVGETGFCSNIDTDANSSRTKVQSSVAPIDGQNIGAVRTYYGHKNRKFTINSKLFSTTTRAFVISGSEDNKAFIWDVNDSSRHECIEEWPGVTDALANSDPPPIPPEAGTTPASVPSAPPVSNSSILTVDCCQCEYLNSMDVQPDEEVRSESPWLQFATGSSYGTVQTWRLQWQVGNGRDAESS